MYQAGHSVKVPAWFDHPDVRDASARADYGKVLHAARIDAGLTLRQAGEVLGCSYVTVSRYETGQQRFTDVTLLRMVCARMRIPPVLFGLADAAPTPRIVAGTDSSEVSSMQRRHVLAGLAATAAVVPGLHHQALTMLTDLDTALHAPASAPAPVSLAQLTKMIHQGWVDFSAVRFRELAVAIPHLIKVADASRAHADSGHEAEFDAALSAAYVLANELTVKLHVHDVSLMLADRAVHAARASEDPMAIARAQWRLAISLRRAKHRDIAEPIALAAAQQLRNAGLQNPKAAGFYSRLLCCAAYSAALEGHQRSALDNLDAAAEVLREFPHAQELRGFGVDSYQVSVHRILGDYGTALDAVRAVDFSLLPTPERQTRYLEDAAITMWGAGQVQDTYHILRRTELVAPDEVRFRPWAHRLTLNLLGSNQRTGLDGLKEFATRIGVGNPV